LRSIGQAHTRAGKHTRNTSLSSLTKGAKTLVGSENQPNCVGQANRGATVRLTVVVPVHNAEALLASCLSSLFASSLPPDEVIVVDDGSSDNSATVARAFPVCVISLPPGPLGPAYARNRGAAVANGELLLFLDADVVVHPDTVARIVTTFAESPAVHALFGSYDDKPAVSNFPSRFKNLLHHYIHQHSSRDAKTFWSVCGAIRRETFLAAGGFTETYRC
jgi:glycosyltransferase involved in cell wall biosynthesis